jgi:hypothetical protein
MHYNQVFKAGGKKVEPLLEGAHLRLANLISQRQSRYKAATDVKRRR